MYVDFDFVVKRISNATSTYKVFSSVADGTNYMLETLSKTAPASTNAFNFTQDFVVNVDVIRYDYLGAMTNTLAVTDAELIDFSIEKYLL